MLPVSLLPTPSLPPSHFLLKFKRTNGGRKRKFLDSSTNIKHCRLPPFLYSAAMFSLADVYTEIGQ